MDSSHAYSILQKTGNLTGQTIEGNVYFDLQAEGSLDLTNSTVKGDIFLSGKIRGDLILKNTKVELGSVIIKDIEIEGNLIIDNCKIFGRIDIQDTLIEGDLEISNTQLAFSDSDLKIIGVLVAGSIIIHDINDCGNVILADTEVDEDLHLSEINLGSSGILDGDLPSGILNLGLLTVKGALSIEMVDVNFLNLDGFELGSTLNIDNSQMAQQFDLYFTNGINCNYHSFGGGLGGNKISLFFTQTDSDGGEEEY